MRFLIDASAARHSGALTQHLGFLPALDAILPPGDECLVLGSPDLNRALGNGIRRLQVETVDAALGWKRFLALNSRIAAYSRSFNPDALLLAHHAPGRNSAPYVLRLTDAHLVDHEVRQDLMRFYTLRERVTWQAKVVGFARASRRASAILCATDAVRAQLLRGLPDVAPERVFVAHYGASPLVARAAQHPGPRGLRLLTMHASPRKNIETILDAMARPGMAESTLTVMADLAAPKTPYHRFLARRIQELGLAARVHSAGYIKGMDALIGLMMEHDILLCPSRLESWSHSVVEGMGIGMPVVASDIDCHREVAGDTAWLVPVEDSTAMAAALASVAAGGPAVRERLDRAMARARGFDWGGYADGALTALRLAAGSPHSA